MEKKNSLSLLTSARHSVKKGKIDYESPKAMKLPLTRQKSSQLIATCQPLAPLVNRFRQSEDQSFCKNSLKTVKSVKCLFSLSVLK